MLSKAGFMVHPNNIAAAPGFCWYVINTKPKQEFRALEQLENQGFECFLPTVLVSRACRGDTLPFAEPLFSRYLFVRLAAEGRSWGPIRSTRGVTSMVAFGGRYATLPDAYVEALRRAPPVLINPYGFKAGEEVRVMQGPFCGMVGIYTLPDGNARAYLLMELMQKPQQLSFPLSALDKAA